MATAKKSSGRKYSPSASKSVETEMHEMKRGKLKSGRSGRKVTNPKQAIAIGLSEARKKGAKVPPPPKKSAKKSAAKKSSAKKTSAKKTSAKKSSAKKSRKSSAKKSGSRSSS